jgi:1,4-dihydroxy-6-naphthoate synthase
MRLSLAYSPCPNDCFIFDAIVHRRVDLEGLEFDVTLADVETLNRAAFEGDAGITKISAHAYAHCRQHYLLLDAGSALGRNCGPLLIARRPLDGATLDRGDVMVAIPGRYTTANFLLGFVYPQLRQRREMVFSEIEGAVLDGSVDAGVIIHENRFTYESRGLCRIADLGERWEQRTRHPIPLGAIAITRSVPESTLQSVNRVMRRSVEFAMAHRNVTLPYVRQHSQEMSEDVMFKHIDLYVNDFTIDLGVDGRNAVRHLLAHVEGVPAPSAADRLFVSQAPRRS